MASAAPATTQPSMAMTTTPVPSYGAVKPNNTLTNTTQPANTNTTMAMASPGSTTPKTSTNSGGPTPASAGNLRFTPRYHGRHGFTPPSHAPPRGQQ